MGLLDGRMAFQKMLTIDHIHSTIWWMECEIQKQKAKATILFDDILQAKKSQRLQMHFKRNHNSSLLLNPCRSSCHSNLLHHHHHQSLSQAPQRTQSTSTKDPENLLSRYKTTPRKVARNSPFGAGQTPRLSTTGRDTSTGTPQGGVKTADQLPMVHGGVGRAWRITLKQAFGIRTNPARFDLGEGAVLWTPLVSSSPPFLPHVLLTFPSFHHCFILIVSPWLMLHLDGCARQHVVQLSLFTHSL